MSVEPALNGKVAVVTGGARGIGAAIVNLLLARGCQVASIDLPGSPGIVAEDFLQIEADVSDAGDIEAARAGVIDRFGRVDILVNNAAFRMINVSPSGKINVLDTELAHWRRMLEVNVIGAVNVLKAFVPEIKKNGRGSIVNISSGSGSDGLAGNQPYGASKAALSNLSRSLAKELRGDNIAVNVVFPPSTASTGARSRAEAFGETGALLRPEATAPVVAFLAGCDASVTGRVFNAWHWNLEHGLGGIEAWAATNADREAYWRGRGR